VVHVPAAKLAILAVTVTLAALAFAAPAGAEVTTYTFRYGPITISPYEVKQSVDVGGVPRPDVSGYITGMDVDIVDASGRQIPIRRIMLHHIVFQDLGHADQTCSKFTLLDSRTQVPALAERFYAAGEERNVLRLPAGYGYQFKASDPWVMYWMLMNHRPTTQTGYIQYHVTVDTSPDLTPVRPIWLDVRNCRTDPVFTVPGGGRRGSIYSRSTTWTAPQAGRLVAAGGHVHGGGEDLVLSQPDCSGRRLGTLRPAWGLPSHPFYNVRPVLHEPGPISMSGFTTQKGIPLAAGEQVRLTANYDDQRLHSRVMGISMAYFAPDVNVTGRCAPLPDDITTYRTTLPHRTRPPVYPVPLTGLDAAGHAHTISRPPGPTRHLGSGASVAVGDTWFADPNVALRRGATLRWRFGGRLLHNVTVANGPRGFASVHLDGGRQFSHRFTVPGTYRLFCALHPVAMTETVTVR
jgi:plastocyanin